MENSKIAMGAGMFLLVAIGAFLIIPMSQEKTLILTTRDDSTPISCLDDDKLILAQNLTDLCDVVIISPTTNQTLVYNGTYWINSDQVIFNDTSTCQNIGNGSAFICVEGTNINFRSILAGSGISVSNSSDTITIVNTLPESTTGSNLGSYGQAVFSSEVGNDLQFKKLLAGTSISVTSNSTNVIISNTSPETTVCSGQTGNYNIVASSSGGNCTFKNLTFGNGISISSNSTHIIITNSKPEQGCTSAGGTSIWKTTTTCDAKGLTAGVGLILTSNTNDNNYKTNFVNGTGISITGSTSQTFTNTGVTSLTSADTDGLSLSASTGAITITPKWELLCQNSGSGTSISCSSFTARKQLFVQIEYRTITNTMQQGIRFNSDSGTNYSTRASSNGGADSTGTSLNQCTLRGGGSFSTGDRGIHSYWIYNNQSGDRKLLTGQIIAGADTSAGTAPTRVEQTCKWDNTGAQITTITLMIVSGTGTYDTGTMITVWGYD